MINKKHCGCKVVASFNSKENSTHRCPSKMVAVASCGNKENSTH